MVTTRQRPTFEDQALQRDIMRLRQVDNYTNLLYLAMEYASLAIVIGSAVVFSEYRASWGIAWSWNIPVFAVAIVLIGGIQHRLAGLGHESSHYSFMKNRVLNDLVPDLFCMFPLMTTIHFYRLFHMGHHQFTNDPERDPDLLNLGHGKRANEFPMTPQKFIAVVYFCFVTAPIRFLAYQWAYVQVNTLGQGKSVYVEGTTGADRKFSWLPRPGTALAFVYLFGFMAFTRYLTNSGRASLLAPAAGLGIVLSTAIVRLVPDRWIFQSPFRQAYSSRFAGTARLTFYTVLITALAHLRFATHGASAIYPVLLWLVPINSSFMFFMFLRDVYQHSNADDGRLTNSRVFFTDPFTRWAVLIYGQDMHIPHHLFPAVPHYRLRELHAILKKRHAPYHDLVVETFGTFHDPNGRTTILDEMTRPRH
jgi:fatty acid desaturase